MIAIKVECMKHMPSDCDFCYWFGTRPHPHKGWTDICELMGHCMDDDQPEEWIYNGDGRPKACPLAEMPDRKTENCSEKPNNCEPQLYEIGYHDGFHQAMADEEARVLKSAGIYPKDKPQTICHKDTKDCKSCGYRLDCRESTAFETEPQTERSEQ